MKQFLTLILAILCSTSIALATTYTGTTGDCTWTLDTSKGTLVISGSGAMGDFAVSSYNSYVRTIIIEDGVTNIGEQVFSSCSNLTSITIPESVTSIGSRAFNNCSSITSITIPDGVTSIGKYAFRNCTSLTSINIPDGVTSIEKGTFYYCSSLASITIPDGVKSIGDYAFYYCSSLASITIPDGVTSIGDYAFYYCSSYYLTNIIIPNSVTSIGDYAFYGCTSLFNVTIGSGVTSIGSRAFWNCSTLQMVTILATTPPTISAKTFSNYTSSVLFAASTEYTTAAYWSKFNTIITEETTLTGICGDDLTYTLILTTDGNASLTIEGTGDMYDYSSASNVPWRAYATSISSVTISDEATSIGSYAFVVCTSLTDIIIPDSVTSIGSSAFFRCTSLTSITIPDGVTSISQGAFEYCSSLTSVTIGSGVTSIGQHAFDGCTSLTSVTSLATTPPTCGTDPFSSSTYSSATLFAASTDYATAEYWENFTNIVYDTSGNAISSVTASTSAIRAIGNAIVITTEAAQSALVYNLSGQLVTKRAVSAGETSIGMPAGGVYIVALADGTKAKVLVK